MKLFLLLISTWPQFSFACEVMPTRFILNKKVINQNEKVCIEGNTANSRECISMMNPKCPFSEIDKNLNYRDFVLPVGSPGFNICHHLGGSPQLYEIKMKSGKWEHYERCFSKDKKHFIDVDNLVKNYQFILR